MLDFVALLKFSFGDVAERLKALDSKSSIGVTLSEVRILPSPPVQNTTLGWYFVEQDEQGLSYANLKCKIPKYNK